MRRRSLGELVLFNISRFVSFYFVIALVVSSSVVLFLKGAIPAEAVIRHNAPETFLWTVVMALLGCGIDSLRRHLTVDRPLKRIIGGLEDIRRGDFSVRLDTLDLSHTGFQEISEGISALARELGSLDTLRSDFISSVSHELRTPLAVVKNYAVLLQDENLSPEERREYARAISETASGLADLVGNILKLNKLENQQIFPETRRFDLGEQVAQCLLAFEPIWEEKGIELECELAGEVCVEADPELLAIVWNNLFSNAMKFTPRGGTVFVRLGIEGDWAVVSVRDTGCGMDQHTGQRIFEKFYQGDTAHQTRGNGLGLALVKRVVDITGGAITVASSLGRGSTFTVRLGRAKDE